MYPLPATRSERREYRDVLESETRTVRFKASVLTKMQRGTGIALDIIDGEVIGDNTDPRVPALSAHITVPRLPKVDHQGHLLRITYGVWLPTSDKWLDIPVFTGPIHQTTRNPDTGTVEIDALGKESQHLDPAYLQRPFNVRKGIRIHRAIRKLFESRGEPGRFRFPNKTKKLNKPRTWPLGASAWLISQRLSRQIDRDLYYRGNGDLVLINKRNSPVWKFKAGRNCQVVERPSRTTSADNLINMVVVRGGKTKKGPNGKRKRVVAKVELRNKHPRSAERLTNGKRPRMLIVDRDKLSKRSDVKQAARKILKRRGGRLSQELNCTVLPVPHLELGDRVLVDVDGVHERFTIRRMNIPLTVDGVTELNWRARRHRRKRK